MFSISTSTLRKTTTALGLALALSSVAACKSEIDEKPKAKVEAADKGDDKKAEDKAGGEAEASAEAKTLQIDPASKVAFIGAKVTGDHKGNFETFTGSATVEGDKLTALELSVEMSSLKTDADEAGLGKHLLSGDFFDAEKFPQAKFTLVSAEAKAGEGGATHEISGNLEMHGKANKVTFPATVTISDTGVSSKAEFSIDRNLWDISHPGKPDDLIKAEVALILELNFK